MVALFAVRWTTKIAATPKVVLFSVVRISQGRASTGCAGGQAAHRIAHPGSESFACTSTSGVQYRLQMFRSAAVDVHVSFEVRFTVDDADAHAHACEDAGESPRRDPPPPCARTPEIELELMLR